MSGDQVITLVLGLGSLLMSGVVAALSFFCFNKNEKIYCKKQETIYESLEFIDRYLSWLDYANADTPVCNPQDTEMSLSEEARKVYNQLICSCTNVDIISVFLDILFKGSDEMVNYNKYRNLCRQELGLKQLEVLSDDKVFLARISTERLRKNTLKVGG